MAGDVASVQSQPTASLAATSPADAPKECESREGPFMRILRAGQERFNRLRKAEALGRNALQGTSRLLRPPAYWFARIAFLVEADGRLGDELCATDLCELSQTGGIPMPGPALANLREAARYFGGMAQAAFEDADELGLGSFKITRTSRMDFSAGLPQQRVYKFARV